MNIKSKSYTLSLLDIVSWADPSHSGQHPELKVAVPTLQRGLVWQPQQIELLWDSIFRGFPIGSLVLCPKIAGQARLQDRAVTHHLLDGQQRCDAIRLGFRDLYSAESIPAGESVLWIDLNPELDPHSTRSFLFRLTNTAHPWGYASNDAATPLRALEMRKALSLVGVKTTDAGYERPQPYQLSPYQSKCPIPLAWLIAAFRQGGTAQACWDVLLQRLAFEKRPNWMAGDAVRPQWSERAQAFLADSSECAVGQREWLYRGMERAMETPIFGLLAPEDMIAAARQEHAGEDAMEGISNVEQLFQRLNRQGTRLDGEELAYSMIKAYWPELAEPIEAVQVKRMPAARLVTLAVRAALTLATGKSPVLHGSLTVSQIRRIATERGAEAVAIQGFIANRLGAACEFVERALRYDASSNPSGLLPVHLAAAAKETPDLYLLLILIADQSLKRGVEAAEFAQIQQSLLRLTMHVRWFSVRAQQAIESIYRSVAGAGFDAATLERSIQAAISSGDLMDLPSEDEVRRFVNFSPIHSLKDWTWSGQFELLRASAEDPGDIDRWETFLRQSMYNRELLLYAQRAYLAERFADYDPAQRDDWMGHNRPWDFDHLHATKFVSNLKRAEKPYLDFAKQWVHLIGNLRAWPFEDNRSDQAQEGTVKLLIPVEQADRKIEQSYLRKEELDSYAGGYVLLYEQKMALRFAKTVMQRTIRIYGECYRVLAPRG